MLLRLLKKVHTYAGLATFVNLAVYGIVGLTIPFLRQAAPSVPAVAYQNFTVPNRCVMALLPLADEVVTDQSRNKAAVKSMFPLTAVFTSLNILSGEVVKAPKSISKGP